MIGNKLHIALVGAGAMGSRWASVIYASKIAKLKYIIDTDITRAAKLAKKFDRVIASKNIKAALNDHELDAVVVVVPHKFLALLSHMALKKGKHVLVEKPGALSSLLLKKNINLAKSANLVLMVGYNHRFHQGFVKARKIVGEGRIGKIIFIRARYGFGGRKGYQKEWRLNKNLSGGGELMDQGVHMIDLAISFIGIPNKITGFAENTFWKSAADDNAFVLMQNKKSIASIHVSLTQWDALHSFEIYGSKGFVLVEGLGKKYGGTEQVRFAVRNDDFNGVSDKKTYKCSSDANRSLRLEFQEFVNSIIEGRTPNPSPGSSYEVLKVVERIYAKR